MKKLNVMLAILLIIMMGGGILISCLSTSEQALALRGGLAAAEVGADVVMEAKEASERAEAEAAAQAREEQRIAEQNAKREAATKDRAEREAAEKARAEEKRLAEEEEKRRLAEIAEPEYRPLFEKASNYEKKGQYFYALAFYFDALQVPNAANEEAAERFKEIGRSIGWYGYPGIKTDDAFTQYNKWIDLLKDAERYWTEYPPYNFTFDITQGDLNYENQTASYHVSVEAYHSAKYRLLMDYLLVPAFKEAYKSDWKNIPQKWPVQSIHRSGKHYVDGAAVLEYDSNFYTPWILYFEEEYMSELEYAAYSNPTHYEYTKKRKYSFYDVKFNIIDQNGNVLLSSKRHLVSPGLFNRTDPWSGEWLGNTFSEKYTFKDVSQSVMQAIDSGASIQITDIYLQYGKAEGKNKVGRDFIKNLKEVSIPLEKLDKPYANKIGYPDKDNYDEEFSNDDISELYIKYGLNDTRSYGYGGK